MLSILLATALAASPYKDLNGDVAITAEIDAPPEAVHAAVEDLKTFQAILACSSDWSFGAVTEGKGASVELTYDIASMHRRLTAVIARSESPRLIDYDHAGNKGFITRWKFEPSGEGTTVSLTSYLNPPPWPFRKVYFERIKPAWEQCYTDALAKLPEHIEAAEAPPPLEPAPEPAEEPPADEPSEDDGVDMPPTDPPFEESP